MLLLCNNTTYSLLWKNKEGKMLKSDLFQLWQTITAPCTDSLSFLLVKADCTCGNGTESTLISHWCLMSIRSPSNWSMQKDLDHRGAKAQLFLLPIYPCMNPFVHFRSWEKCRQRYPDLSLPGRLLNPRWKRWLGRRIPSSLLFVRHVQNTSPNRCARKKPSYSEALRACVLPALMNWNMLTF